jgi:hypothetical protein
MTQSSVTDVVGFFVFISALFFSAEVAAVVGPHILMAIAAAVGASFSLARREKTTRLRAIGFFLRVMGLAVLVTGSIAAFTNAQHPSISERALLAPVALLVGFIGDGWPALLTRVVKVAFAAVDLLRGKGGVS